MKKSIIVVLIIIVALIFLFFLSKNNNHSSTLQFSDDLILQSQNDDIIVDDVVKIENDLILQSQNDDIIIDDVVKIEVVHFYGTNQCWSCITVGEYALKTIKEKFPEEHKNGVIIFKGINAELVENRDMVIKYQARGSSLFINEIKNGKDNIEEDVTVWRMVTNEIQFMNYFENKLNKLLGK